jgi:hypothetical protein
MGIFPTVSVPTTMRELREALEQRGCVVADQPGGADVVLTRAPQAESAEQVETATTVASRDTDGAEQPREDLFARVDRATLAAAEGLVVSGRSSGRRVTLPFAPVPGDVVSARSFAELVHNAVCLVAARPTGRRAVAVHPLVQTPAWTDLKAAVSELRTLQAADGSVPERGDHARASALVARIVTGVEALAPSLSHDADYLEALVKDFGRWADGGFEVPDFYDSILAFAPAQHRVDGLPHLVLFPMYTQNGNPNRQVEAILLEVIWPDFVADLEAGDYSNKLFLPIRFLDFTEGYDTNSAVLFPETVAMREVPAFTWGGIFADREAARFRRVVTEAAAVTRLSLPPDAARLIADQELAERAFVMWDLIHDRTHMHGDLPFDPFMIKQRMPYFLYSLEELRCDLTAFREAVALEADGHPYARSVQYAVLFDRIFRFAITGDRTRNYDGLGGQLLFAWLHQKGVLHWTDNRLSIDWADVAEPVLELGRAVEDLYWRSIDRPKIAHWLAAYALVSSVLTPHPLSAWAQHQAGDLTALPLDGPPKGLTDAVLPDEFPLSMFYEALSKKMKGVIGSTAGITGASA